jgi:hypothetical protein
MARPSKPDSKRSDRPHYVLIAAGITAAGAIVAALVAYLSPRQTLRDAPLPTANTAAISVVQAAPQTESFPPKRAAHRSREHKFDAIRDHERGEAESSLRSDRPKPEVSSPRNSIIAKTINGDVTQVNN